MLKKNKGQVTVVIALSFSFLFVLFAMVVNISFLVTAKINLQNSVDMAAYAGASQQSRFLTEIGKWNYEMRRIYKAFVYDYRIMLTAEVNPEIYKKYILNEKNGGNFIPPIACCSLHRVYGSGGTKERKILCQFDNVADGLDQLNQAKKLLDNSILAVASAAVTMDPTILALSVQNLINASTISDKAESFKLEHQEILKNYAAFNNGDRESFYNGTNQIPVFNYNYRLLSWMTHAYRHMQARIRGVHLGNLDIGGKNYDPNTGSVKDIPNRLMLTKDDTPAIFDNAPISVAAKIINSYKDKTNNPGLQGSSKKYLDLSDADKEYTAKNPIHYSAKETFNKNLINVIEGARLYHIIPQANSTGTLNIMAKGCGGQCKEFVGPYLRLFSHDLSFILQYMITQHIGTSYKNTSRTAPVNNFPLGVVKDRSILTYYTTVGVASTKEIPFNVFFGESGEKSKTPPLVAVASARPFGSRIGPYIDSTSNSCNLETSNQCIKQGFDPLYPSTSTSKVIPDFSILNPPATGGALSDIYLTGVKYTVGQNEYKGLKPAPSNKPYMTPHPNPIFSTLMAKTEDANGRWRYFRNPNNNKLDDGFPYSSAKYMESSFYEQQIVSPQACKNSIIAWNGKALITAKAPSPENNLFETYFEKHGSAVQKMGKTRNKQSSTSGGNGTYHIYLFKYPKPENNTWDIENLTKKTGNKWTNQMEKSFANAMAVSEFEVSRYIIPYSKKAIMSSSSGGGTSVNNVFNWYYSINEDGYIFKGANNREKLNGKGNKKLYGDIITGTEGESGGGSNFPETDTAWLKGIRGYRVKFVITQTLTRSNLPNGKSLSNPLPQNISLKTDDKTINLDLSKIPY